MFVFRTLIITYNLGNDWPLNIININWMFPFLLRFNFDPTYLFEGAFYVGRYRRRIDIIVIILIAIPRHYEQKEVDLRFTGKNKINKQIARKTTSRSLTFLFCGPSFVRKRNALVSFKNEWIFFISRIVVVPLSIDIEEKQNRNFLESLFSSHFRRTCRQVKCSKPSKNHEFHGWHHASSVRKIS